MKLTQRLSDLFCKLTNIRILPVLLKKGTFKFSWVNFKTSEARALYVQFSLKDPWLIPHHEEHFGGENVDIPLSGWLFFYFGALTEGVIYSGDENSILTDAKGDRYYCYKVPRNIGDNYHLHIKNGDKFDISVDDSHIYIRQIDSDDNFVKC